MKTTLLASVLFTGSVICDAIDVSAQPEIPTSVSAQLDIPTSASAQPNEPTPTDDDSDDIPDEPTVSNLPDNKPAPTGGVSQITALKNIVATIPIVLDSFFGDRLSGEAKEILTQLVDLASEVLNGSMEEYYQAADRRCAEGRGIPILECKPTGDFTG